MSSLHSPRKLLNAVAARANKAIRQLEFKYRLVSMSVTSLGDMEFVLGRRGDEEPIAVVTWSALPDREREPIPVQRFGGFLSARTGARGDDVQPAIATIQRTLSTLPEELAPVLRFAQSQAELPFDKKVSERLFGPAIAVGTTRWGNLVCVKMEQSFAPPAHLMVRFGNDDKSYDVQVLPAFAEGRDGSAPPFTVRPIAQDGGDVSVAHRAVAEFISFVVARRVPGTTVVKRLPSLEPEPAGQSSAMQRAPWDYGLAVGWQCFWHMNEVAEGHQVRRLLVGPHVEVLLGERECFTAHASFHGPDRSPFRFPGLRPWPATYHNRLLSTVLSEAHVITGADQEFARLLSSAHSRLGSEPGVVIVSDTCVSTLLGLDADKLSDSVTGGALAATEVGENIYVRNEQFVEKVLGRSRNKRRASEAGPTVNLVGFLPGPARRELVELLGLCGVEVAGCFLPDMDVQALDSFGNAGACIAMPGAHRRNVYEAVSHASGLPLHDPPGPYGIAGTMNWLEHVCELAGARDGAIERVATRAGLARQTVTGLAARCRGVRVLFVLNGGDVHLPDTPDVTLGIPVLTVLKEAGLPLQCVYIADVADTTSDFTLELRTRYGYEDVRIVKTQRELHQILATRPAQLVYSDLSFDDRVLRHGMNTFCLQEFEMGLDGAARTVKRLLRRGSNRFIGERMLLPEGASA